MFADQALALDASPSLGHLNAIMGKAHYGQHASLSTLANVTGSHGQLQVVTCGYDTAGEALTGMIRAGEKFGWPSASLATMTAESPTRAAEGTE